jgi:hypothetical protein
MNKITIGVKCLAKSAKTILSPNNALNFIKKPTQLNAASSSLTDPTLITLDITDYFDSPTEVCAYTSCGFFDSPSDSAN